MGLDISFGAFNGAYSAFNTFRKIIAEATGGSFPPHNDETLEPNMWYFGEGHNKKTHKGLYELLSHSDCDGKINYAMCRHVAKELEQLLPKIEEIAKTKPCFGHIERDGGYVAVTKRFIEGCNQAIEQKKPLRFY